MADSADPLAKDENSTDQAFSSPGDVAGADDCEDSIDLFLVGKTGHGKSSSGNTILQRKAFATSDLAQSMTETSDVAWTEKDGLIIKVVDTPGISDTRMSPAERMEFEIKNIAGSFQHCPNGFHALLLVYKYGNRFTKEEKETIDFLKKVLGSNFIKDHCILVLTHGEDFDLQAERTPGTTFDKWRKNQIGPLGDLIQECQNRVVLFRNSMPKVRTSVDELLCLAKNIPRYTHVIFAQWKTTRQSLIDEAAATQLKETIQPKIGLLIESLNRIVSTKMSHKTTQEHSSRLKKQAQDLEREVMKEGNETDVSKSLKFYVKNLLGSIESHEALTKAKEKEEETQRKIMEIEEAQATFSPAQEPQTVLPDKHDALMSQDRVQESQGDRRFGNFTQTAYSKDQRPEREMKSRSTTQSHHSLNREIRRGEQERDAVQTEFVKGEQSTAYDGTQGQISASVQTQNGSTNIYLTVSCQFLEGCEKTMKGLQDLQTDAIKQLNKRPKWGCVLS